MPAGMIPDASIENRLEIRQKRPLFKEIPMDQYDVPAIIAMSGIEVQETRHVGDSYVIEGRRGDQQVSMHLYPTGRAELF